MKSDGKTLQMDADHRRLEETRTKAVVWRKWGPYLSERQRGTLREDYSDSGNVWDYFSQASSPGADKEANWLPAPANGPFNLTVRDYWPKETVLDGTYKLPPVKKVQ